MKRNLKKTRKDKLLKNAGCISEINISRFLKGEFSSDYDSYGTILGLQHRNLNQNQ